MRRSGGSLWLVPTRRVPPAYFVPGAGRGATTSNPWSVTSLSLLGPPWAMPTGLRARVSRARGLESSTRIRALVVVALAVLAYHHSLLALTTFLTADTPLAYLGLLPLLVLGVALV